VGVSPSRPGTGPSGPEPTPVRVNGSEGVETMPRSGTTNEEIFPPTWIKVEVLADKNGVPGEIRLRRALKCLLRSFSIRCTRLTGRPPDATENASTH